jgi:5,10-methylenetetrahydromethanopterin reductase
MATTARLACAFAPSIDLPEYARLAEELGYERVWVYDSPPLYGDVWITLARVAAATERIGVAAGVVVPFLRHPMVTASAIATMEQVAPGRLTVGFGTGYTAARAMGRKPMRWADVATYVGQVRGLLAGDVVDVDGHNCRMIHSPNFGPPRPIDVPLFIAPMGPKGFEVARQIADGIIAVSPPGTAEWKTCALMCSGTVLDSGEDIRTPRVVETVGVGYATALHGLYQMAPEIVQSLPGGEEWIAGLEAEFGPDDRHWGVHEGHLVTITDRDRPAVELAGEGLPQFTWAVADDPETVRKRVAEAVAGGVTEFAYSPVGPDIARELRAFAAAVHEA